MYHNLNSLQSRSGNQLPFSSINYGTCTLPEGRMVIKALLDVSIKGVGKLHRTSIFPCGIFQLMKGVNSILIMQIVIGAAMPVTTRMTQEHILPRWVSVNSAHLKSFELRSQVSIYSYIKFGDLMVFII